MLHLFLANNSILVYFLPFWDDANIFTFIFFYRQLLPIKQSMILTSETKTIMPIKAEPLFHKGEWRNVFDVHSGYLLRSLGLNTVTIENISHLYFASWHLFLPASTVSNIVQFIFNLFISMVRNTANNVRTKTFENAFVFWSQESASMLMTFTRPNPKRTEEEKEQHAN